MIRVKFCKIAAFQDSGFENKMILLPKIMQNEIREYKFKKNQKSRLISRLILRQQLINDNCEGLLSDWVRLENEKPIIPGWNNFSISHTENLVLFSDSTTPIGIDVEKHVAMDFKALSNFFSSEEKDYILSSKEVQNRFFEIWVKKEAVLKALGTGIIKGMKEFNCINDSVIIKGNTWCFYKLDLGEAYTSYLCLPTNSIDFVIEEYLLD